MGWYENYEKAATDSRMKICPICGKRFYPAPEHTYRAGYDVDNEKKSNYKLVCSYSCMRKWEKDHEKKKTKNPYCRKPVIATLNNGNKKLHYSSVAEAARDFGVTSYHIHKAIKSGSSINGFKFERVK